MEMEMKGEAEQHQEVPECYHEGVLDLWLLL